MNQGAYSFASTMKWMHAEFLLNLLVIWRAEPVPSVQDWQDKMTPSFAKTELHT